MVTTTTGTTTITQPPPLTTCPHCGYCPHCGRSGHTVAPGTYPTYPYVPVGPTWVISYGPYNGVR